MSRIERRTQLLVIGGYSPPRGTAAGMTLLEHDLDTGDLEPAGQLVDTPSPTALAASGDSRYLFAVEETAEGKLHSFRWAGGSLEPVSEQPSGGGDPCHVLVHPAGTHLLTTNFSGGNVTAHPIGDGGVLGRCCDAVALTGAERHPTGRTQSHPHQTVVRPGTSEVAVVDLGADVVHRMAFDPAVGRFDAIMPGVQLPAGSGPRQLVFSSDGLTAFVLGQLDSSLTIFDWSGPSPVMLASVPCLDPLPRDNAAATLLLNGGQLFASHRGANVVTRHCASVDLTRVATLDAHGRGPRHIALAGRYLYLANEESNTVVARPLDDSSPVASLPTSSPTFVLPIDEPDQRHH